MVTAVEELGREAPESFAPFCRVQRWIELVEYVVGQPGETVQGVYGWALGRGEQPRREEEGPAVLRVQLATALIRMAQMGITYSRRVEFRTHHDCRPPMSRVRGLDDGRCSTAPVMRSAARRPDRIVVGTPTPGTVEPPASTALSMPRTVFVGRNGPVWAKVCASANGVPADMPWRAQSAGLTTSRTSTSSS